jgi:DNA repair exonuclease SbcCD nuclease subunit
MRTIRFLHSADWHLGKPYAKVEDPRKRSLLQQERLRAIQRLGETARQNEAEFILIAGDVFDSSTADKGTVSEACSAVGAIGLPVLAIPGNHDHGGPGSVWEQDFFQRVQSSLAPNFRVLLAPEPVQLESAVVFPCPLLRRAEPRDTTQWLRSDLPSSAFPEKVRIVLAHGSTQVFGQQDADDESGNAATNHLELDLLPPAGYDYVALGDWHGTKRLSARAWYSGTPELDRFPKGEEHDQGNVLLVEACRGADPVVTPVPTTALRWHSLRFDFADESGLEVLENQLNDMLGQRAGQDLLRLELHGNLGIIGSNRLQSLLETLEARLLRLKCDSRVVLTPAVSELEALTTRCEDPLIARVAAQLVARASGADESVEIARLALRQLHAECAHL